MAAGSERRCHYEVLGLRLDCSADEIRPAYKKLALQLHPDKLVQSGLSQAEATAKFQELSHAYEVLSDPKERAWYDSHRSKILYADPSTSNSTVPDLFSYFSNSAFSGYSSDSKKSFFRVYSEVFNRVYANEVDFARKMGLGVDAVREAPAMGDLDSPYTQASAFYGYWTGFSTVMDFCWADPYDAAAGLNRKSRRVMEDENAKARRKARREYNETVRGLAEFAKKRDKRVIDMAVRRKEEEEKRKEEQRERRKREERERIERAMAYREPDWAQTAEDGDEVLDDDEEETAEKEAEEEELYCVACGKKFKSEKQWKNHEQSKKHKEKVAQIRREVVDDDEDDGDKDEEVEELGEVMRDKVQIGDEEGEVGPSDEAEEKEDDIVVEEEEEEKEKEEEENDVKNENVVEEDEIGVLEAMLGGRKNRKKASVMRKVEENDDDGDMEYNNRKSTRKSRRAKKGKNNGNLDAEKLESNGNDMAVSENGSGGAKEELDNDTLAEVKKQTDTDQRVDKKGMVSKSKTSSKGKKAKAAKNTGHTCEKCGEDFESKNKLYKHLSDTGHATLKYR